MQDRSNAQRAKARAMMPGMATGVSNLSREMTNPAPRSPAARLAPEPSDKYVRPGTGSKERPMSAYANGGKVQRERGEKEVIEFSGDELEKMDRVGRNDSGGRYKAATEAFKTQLGRGKTLGVAKDAADVMRSRYANGGKVKARLAESRGMERKKANERVAESRGMERAEMRKDIRQDKKTAAKFVHKHEAHLHKGEPKTKFAMGGKVGKYAMGGAAKIRKGQAKPVSKMPKGGNPVY